MVVIYCLWSTLGKNGTVEHLQERRRTGDQPWFDNYKPERGGDWKYFPIWATADKAKLALIYETKGVTVVLIQELHANE